MPAGRPTKYNDDIVQKAKDYVSGHYLKEGHTIPSISGMALYLDVSRECLYEWAKDPEKEFSYILDKCNMTQETVLLTGGLTNEMNPTIVKLALGKQGYTDKLDQVSDVNVNVSQYSDEQLDAIINQNS